MLNQTDFITELADALKTADGLAPENPVSIAWGVGTEPDTIMVTDSEGTIWWLNVVRFG